MRAALLLVALAACAGDEREAMDARADNLGPLAFEVPSDWKRADHAYGELRTSVWKPDDNERKESITVIRVERATKKTSGTPLDELVEQAQGSLDQSRVTGIEKITTKRGFSGVRASVSFKPRMLQRTYQRMHATLVDGDALVHVFYTAADPDSSFEAFNMVLDTIRHEGA